MFRVKEDVPVEEILSSDGSKKIIEYGEVEGIISFEKDVIKASTFSNWRGRGKLTATHMKITLFDKTGKKIEEYIKENENYNYEEFSYLCDKIMKKDPNVL